MVSCGEDVVVVDPTGPESGASHVVSGWTSEAASRPHNVGFPQQPPPFAAALEVSVRLGQFPHGVPDETDLLIAAQNAFPNASSAQARQFEGSPEQLGSVGRDESGAGDGDTGKVSFAPEEGPRRRKGTGGW